MKLVVGEKKEQRLIFGICTALAVFIGLLQPLSTYAQNAHKVAPPVITPVGVPYIYKKVDGQELSLYVEAPEKSSKNELRPAMLFFHGGGWTGGPLNEFDRQAEYLASRGLVAIQVQYRFAKMGTSSPIDQPIEDSKSAMRWVRSHASTIGVDPNRIGAAGASAGGQLAAFLGMMTGEDDPTDDMSVSSVPNIMVLFNPAIDLGPDGCCHRQGGDDYKAVSPLYHVGPKAPPSLVMHGTSDHLVSPQMISGFVDEMKRAGNDCTLVLYPDGGHGFFNFKEYFYQTLQQTDEFLSKHGWLQGPPNLEAIHKLPPRPKTATEK